MIDGTLEAPPETRNQANSGDLWVLLRGTRSVAVDIETTPETPQEPWTGKDPTRALLKQIGFGDEETGISIFWEDASKTLRESVKQLLADPKLVKVFHNGPWFDIRVLERYGMPVVNWEDTRDMRRAVSSTSKLSLNHLGSLATDIHAWKSGDDKFDEDSVDGPVEDFAEDAPTEEPVAAWASDDKEEAGKYNALDCAVTARVYRMCLADMHSERKAGAPVAKLYEVHKKLSLITAEMHTTGIYVNKDWRGFLLTCLEQSVEEKRALVKVAVGDENFPVTANGMRALIYRRHAKTGIKCFHVPDPVDKRMYTNPELKETIAVNENSLLMLLVSGMAPDELVPIIEAWWTYQGEVKRLGYVKSALLDHATGPDGRLRPGWNSCGADTMRFSCSQPNVMNIEQMLRVMLGPAPGNAMVHADKASLEIRVMHGVTGDTNLGKGIALGSVYSFDAHEWFKVPRDQDPKKTVPSLYKACKIIHLGAQYGAGDKTIWSQALRQERRFKWAQVVALSKQFKATYRGVMDYWAEEMERVQACGYSEGRILKGRRYYPTEPELSETVNYPIQRTAAEMMNLELIELHERLRKEAPRARIVFQLHDAIDVEAPEADADCVQRIVASVMNREWTFCGRTNPYPVEIKTAYASAGQTWADL
jgi:DNA polymerase I-like protein with 3'-5' exonuclease and polymerase domains